MELILNIKSYYVFNPKKSLDLKHNSSFVKQSISSKYNESYIKHNLFLLDANENLIFKIKGNCFEDMKSSFKEKYKEYAVNCLMFKQNIQQKIEPEKFKDNEIVFEIENKFKTSFVFIDEVDLMKIEITDLMKDEQYRFDLDREDVNRGLDITLNEIEKLLNNKNGKKYKIK